VNRTVIPLLGLILALPSAVVAAVVTSPSDAAVTVVASAFVGSDGTMIAQDGSWVSSVFVATGPLRTYVELDDLRQPPKLRRQRTKHRGSGFRQRSELRRAELPVRGDLAVGNPNSRKL
jgi:hypothetical protein